jgi:hypothetical protein
MEKDQYLKKLISPSVQRFDEKNKAKLKKKLNHHYFTTKCLLFCDS